MKPTNKTELEWLVKGIVLSTQPDYDWNVIVEQQKKHYTITFVKYEPNEFKTAHGEIQVEHKEIRNGFYWSYSQDIKDLINETEQMIIWLSE